MQIVFSCEAFNRVESRERHEFLDILYRIGPQTEIESTKVTHKVLPLSNQLVDCDTENVIYIINYITCGISSRVHS